MPPEALPRRVRAVGALVVVACAALLAYPVVDAVLQGSASLWIVLACAVAEVLLLAIGLAVLHGRGALTARPARSLRPAAALWLAIWCVPWGVLVALTPHAAYFGIALFVLVLWLLPPVLGSAVTIALAILTVAGQIVHHGWSAGSVLGPVAAAALAIGFMAAFRAIVDESRERARLLAELESAQARLADSERRAGVLDERGRLGRELHDTVAQSLSSVQLLLHAAERAEADDERTAHVLAAREAAADALAETRRFVHDLSPAPLDGASLVTALTRLVTAAGSGTGAPATAIEIEGAARELPMPIEATLVRVAQEALNNVVQHANASRCDVRLAFDDDAVTLDVVDDGAGFTPPADGAPPAGGRFGLRGMRTRAAELGGYAAVESEPGEGTVVSVRLPARREGREDA